ncbi:penicillin-binding protein 1C [Pseudooceanicola algae]|uniref:peptidoglycan glycosyltransferase n=1 Tax=Pseudooceanicola algae TaxID=1537215 RepID=A0A418SAV5_9RHOB|nr:penicillin-binding protein 1C [Pseudooceanicola algae]QPM91256.1 Biosynthetic peptidoglycan transglycosylase [Pseudooceanicola algae]
MTRRAASALGLGLALALGAAVAGEAGRNWVAQTQLPPLSPALSVEMRGAEGDLLRVYPVEDGRWRLAPGAVDPLYLRMLTAYEDRRFADHHGVDPWAAGRALWQAARAGGVVSGASTLTMQVARLLEDSGTGQWAGKLRQLRVALALEQRLSKAEILDLYLALAPVGGNLEGLRAATLAYFGKEPARLTPAEAALLVALPQSPEARRPDRAPEAAKAARDRVLQRMANAGVLTGEAARAARSEPVPRLRRPFPALAPHLTDRIRRENPGQGPYHLTLDAELQARLETLAAEALRGETRALSMAILVADHRSGAILASVGSRGFGPQGQGFVDMTHALRSPGSTLKPLIFALAFDRGLAQPETLIDDRPTDFAGYRPGNFDGQFHGMVSAAEALRLSLNLPAVLLTEALGPARLMAALRRAGTEPVLPGGAPGLAIALGGLGVTLTDLVQLYAGLAEGGQARPISALPEARAGDLPRITSRASAWQVGQILSQLAPPPGAPRDRIAYKTGTSYGHLDAWAIGFDGAHVVGVWVGRPDGSAVPGAFGGETAAPILFDAFQHLGARPTPLPPPPPETLIAANTLLPAPMRVFHRRGGGLVADASAPELAFPPDGALVELTQGALPVRVRRGTPPFTWLVNGAPVSTAQRRPEALLPGMEPGFADVTVIDAEGRSARASIRLN